jgi:DNA mismatch endonuclease (patch repair protein)
MDTICSQNRSAIMARIKGKNTTPEMAVRRAAHGLGFRFRLHRRDLPGMPDLVFPRFRRVLFVHGCFWHQHLGCRRSNTPKSRVDYWQPKLTRNVERDHLSLSELERLGWGVDIIWECETASLAELEVRIAAFLSSGQGEAPHA